MTIKLNAKPRTVVGKKVADLRQADIIPAVLYGHGDKNLNLALPFQEFNKVFAQAGENTIIDLAVAGTDQPIKVLVADTQLDPIKNQVIHVDLKRIKMDEKITANISINYIGEAPAVKELGGIFVHNLDELEIKCLPGDLIHEVDVDISTLKSFDDIISIADLSIPATIEIIGHEPTDVVATVTPQKVEAEPVVETSSAETEEQAKSDDKDQKDQAQDSEANSKPKED